MNEMIIISSVILVNIIAITIYLLIHRRQQRILVADASIGHIPNLKRKPSNNLTSPSRVILPSGKYVNINDYICAEVVGNSMKPCGINSGDLVCFEPKKAVKVKSEDVVLLYIPDDKQYKVRVVRDISNKTDDVVTYHFDDEQKKHVSVRNSKESNIIGVARYVVSNN